MPIYSDNVGHTAAQIQYLNGIRICFLSFFLGIDGVFPAPRAVRHPRHQRPGPQPGEVRVRHLVAGFYGSPHLRHWHRIPPGQHNFQVNKSG